MSALALPIEPEEPTSASGPVIDLPRNWASIWNVAIAGHPTLTPGSSYLEWFPFSGGHRIPPFSMPEPLLTATSSGISISLFTGQSGYLCISSIPVAASVVSQEMAPWFAAFFERQQAPANSEEATPAVNSGRPGAAIAELRRLSGLTWDQLAALFGVNRRSLHFWASGQAMTPSHQEHLQRLLLVIRTIDRGSASANRSLLLGACRVGIPLDLLTAKHYEDVLSMFGRGEAGRITPPPLTTEAQAARAPRPPAELVDALHDRIHADRGAHRPAKSVKVRSKR